MSFPTESELSSTAPSDTQWLDDGTPFSTAFQDVYYSRDDGLAESEFVFLHHNALESRWAALADSPATCFTIGETGFGTGLNFLLAWRLWLRVAPASARLLFRSLEAFPLTAPQIARALSRWPELQREAALLCARLPPLLPGLHTLDFEDGRVTLQLFIGDIGDALDQYREDNDATRGGIDAWFLDGFSPARNPQMWNEGVMRQVAALSRPDATAATFTVASAVRQALVAAGFTIAKQPGFGSKREMLTARFESTTPASEPRPRESPWHACAYPILGARNAIVIGAGIAGSCAARSLARRGWDVTVLDAAAEPALHASGNPQAALFTQLAIGNSPHGEFTVHSYLHALRHHADLLGDDAAVRDACGLLQLYDALEEPTLQSLRARYGAYAELVRFVSADEASALAGARVDRGGLFLPGSGWIDPREACRRALEQPRISTRFGARVSALSSTDDGWRVTLESGEHCAAAIVVIAAGTQAGGLLPAAKLPLTPVRGQVTVLPQALLGAQPRCVISAEGYVIPARRGRVLFGASFDRRNHDAEVRMADHAGNIDRLRGLLPDCAVDDTAVAQAEGRAAVRCTTPDRLPIAGPVPDVASLESLYAPLRFDARRIIAQRPACIEGLYLSIGHGSRGMTSAPLCAELIAAHASAEPAPVPRRLLRALSPARFTLRRIIKGLQG